MGLMHQRDRLRALLYQMTEHEVRAYLDLLHLRRSDWIAVIIKHATDAQVQAWLDAEECEKTGGTP